MESVIGNAAKRAKEASDERKDWEGDKEAPYESKASVLRRAVTEAFQEHLYDVAHNSASDAERARRLAFLERLSREVGRIAFHPDGVIEGEFNAFCEKLAYELGSRMVDLIIEANNATKEDVMDKHLKVDLNWEMSVLVRIVNFMFWEV